ncbi:MAG: hypothetical protein ACI89Z_001288 [Porticoccus sp.]|jgi:hypothetical protein
MVSLNIVIERAINHMLLLGFTVEGGVYHFVEIALEVFVDTFFNGHGTRLTETVEKNAAQIIMLSSNHTSRH